MVRRWDKWEKFDTCFFTAPGYAQVLTSAIVQVGSMGQNQREVTQFVMLRILALFDVTYRLSRDWG